MGVENPSGAESLVVGQATVGRSQWYWAWWTSDPEVYEVDVFVDTEHRRRGYGTELFGLARARVRDLGARMLTKWISSEDLDALAFAGKLGYLETGETQQTCALDLAEMTEPDESADPIVSLAELAPSEGFLRELHLIGVEAGGSFESWRESALEGDGQSYETTWVWIEAGRPVGMTYLTRIGDGEYENDFTVVNPEFRRKGIARALKRRSISWGIRSGARRFVTSSLVGNDAMRSVNRKLGYVDGPQLIRFELRLQLVETARKD